MQLSRKCELIVWSPLLTCCIATCTALYCHMYCPQLEEDAEKALQYSATGLELLQAKLDGAVNALAAAGGQAGGWFMLFGSCYVLRILVHAEHLCSGNGCCATCSIPRKHASPVDQAWRAIAESALLVPPTLRVHQKRHSGDLTNSCVAHACTVPLCVRCGQHSR